MRVLIVTLIFPPDGVSTSQLLGEIAEDLQAGDNQVSVITTTPHYNRDEAAEAAQPLADCVVPFLKRSSFKGIPVTHVAMSSKASNPAVRAGQWAWFHLVSAWLIWRRRHETDVILTVSPPLTVATVCSLLGRFTGTPFVFAVWEMYPDILVRLGTLRKGWLFRVLKALERSAYRSAARSAFLSEQMKASAVATEPRCEQTAVVVPTFVDCSGIAPGARSTTLRADAGFGDEFVVGYAGNVGRAQNLDALLDVASALSSESVSFLVSGDGVERTRLEARSADEGLDRVVFTGHLPFERVPEIYASADISVVSLAESVGAEALPSKVYRIMAAGRPILGFAKTGSPLDELIQLHGAGACFEPDDLEGITAFLRACVSGHVDVAAMGERARSAATRHYDRRIVTKRYEQMLIDVAS